MNRKSALKVQVINNMKVNPNNITFINGNIEAGEAWNKMLQVLKE